MTDYYNPHGCPYCGSHGHPGDLCSFHAVAESDEGEGIFTRLGRVLASKTVEERKAFWLEVANSGRLVTEVV